MIIKKIFSVNIFNTVDFSMSFIGINLLLHSNFFFPVFASWSCKTFPRYLKKERSDVAKMCAEVVTSRYFCFFSSSAWKCIKTKKNNDHRFIVFCGILNDETVLYNSINTSKKKEKKTVHKHEACSCNFRLWVMIRMYWLIF